MSEPIPSNGALASRALLKGRYRAQFRAIAGILFEEDLMGLASAGAPLDEYEPEAGTILPRLRMATSPDDVEAIVESEFERWFGLPVQADRAAKRIWAAWIDDRPNGG